jgi:hypothetical protein
LYWSSLRASYSRPVYRKRVVAPGPIGGIEGDVKHCPRAIGRPDDPAERVVIDVLEHALRGAVHQIPHALLPVRQVPVYRRAGQIVVFYRQDLIQGRPIEVPPRQRPGIAVPQVRVQELEA